MIDTNFEKYDMEYLVMQYETMVQLFHHPESFGKERIEKMRVAFDSYDKDGNGVLDKNEIHDLLAMNFKESGVSKKPTKQDVDDFFKQIDDDGNCEIDFDEFKDFML